MTDIIKSAGTAKPAHCSGLVLVVSSPGTGKSSYVVPSTFSCALDLVGKRKEAILCLPTVKNVADAEKGWGLSLPPHTGRVFCTHSELFWFYLRLMVEAKGRKYTFAGFCGNLVQAWRVKFSDAPLDWTDVESVPG